jgi:hypothetical protein
MFVLPWEFGEGILPHYTGGKAGYLEIKAEDLPPGREPIAMEVCRLRI